MTSTQIVLRRQAIALRRALELAETLDPKPETLRLAMDEPIREEGYALTEVVASLTRICRMQADHIVELAERLAALEGKAAAKG
jgi:hypothetical protein